VVVEATGELRPEPTPPPPLQPGRLYYLILGEVISAPPGSAVSPLHRSFGPAPLGIPDPEFLRDDLGGEEVAGSLADWQSGRFASGADLLLVQWSMAWGERGDAGKSRRWGVCSLPCTLSDNFFAGKARHPADPIDDALALFAVRPGATDLAVSVDDSGALEVSSGGRSLLTADGEKAHARAKTTWKLAFAAADGTLSKARPFRIQRRLGVLHHSVTALPIEERAEPAPSEARLYPDLSESSAQVPPKVRGVEGLPQVWAWEEASRFEGQFGIRPLPSQEGLTVERAEQLVRWIPNPRQAGEGVVDFSLYSVSRGGVSAVFKPFPHGALAMAATVGQVEGRTTRFRVAGPAAEVAVARAREVLDAFSRFQGVLPLPDEGLPDEVLVYLSPQPLGVIAGGSGGAPFSLVVDERRSEEASIARAWAHLLLGANVATRSPQVADWVRFVEARLLGGQDWSLWAAVFAAAGDDVLEVWSQRLRAPEHKGAPDPGEFLRWVSGKIPVLGRELYTKLPARQWLVGSALASLPLPIEGGPGAGAKAAVAPYGSVLALKVPAVALQPGKALSLLVSPGDGATAQWSAQVVDPERWSKASGDLEIREALAAGWDSFVPASLERVPIELPESSIDAGAVVAVLLRGQAAWQAQVSLAVLSAEPAQQ
jgi:hypothetical protein